MRFDTHVCPISCVTVIPSSSPLSSVRQADFGESQAEPVAAIPSTEQGSSVPAQISYL